MGFFKRLWRHAFFSEVNPIIRLGATRALEADDLPDLPAGLDPRHPSVDVSRIDWSTGPRLLKTLVRASLHLSLIPLVFYLGNVAFTLLGPVLVNGFVRTLQTGLTTEAQLWTAGLYALAIGLAGILAGVCIQHYFYRSLKRQQIMINVINTKIFGHALVLNKSARERIPAGDIVNHLSTDTDSISEVNNALSDLVYCVTIIGGAIGLLFYYIGSTAWVAVGLLALLGPVTRKVSRDFTRFDEDLMKHRDRRVSLMSQILNAVRLVKYFAWETSVHKDVAAIRADELAARKRIARAELLVTLIYVSVGTLVLFSVLAVHSLRGGSFEPALIFTCVSLFSLLEDPFAFISRVVSTFINAKVGADRVSKFLNEPVTLTSTGWSHSDRAPLGFRMENLCVHQGEARHPSLRDVSLSLKPGESLAVVGPVGSGKSTFIHALLGEIGPSSGRFAFVDAEGGVRSRCRIGYVPQEAYILNSTLRENLTFGNDGVSEEDIWRALETAGLAWDIRAMAGGLDTEIGEKGINLSGGQRQRVSLARAVLHRPQMAVLDDPLSAVDPSTETYLAEHLLFGEWKDLTRVVITHRLSQLERFDKIAFLEEGRIAGCGSFSELRESCPGFRAYIEEYRTSHAEISAERQTSEGARPSGEALRITEDEDREWGAVSGGVYWDYVLSLGGESKRWRPWVLFALFTAAASGTVFPLLQKFWLAFVSNTQSGQTAQGWQTWFVSWAAHPLSAVYIYGLLGLVVMAGTLSADLFWLKRGLAAGRNIHDKMFKSVLGTGIRFFDSTPAGRIVQRFARDMEAIDIQLQWTFEHSMKCFAQVLVTLFLIVTALPVVIVFIAPVLAIYYRVQKLYRSSAREAKRLDSISRSPRYAHFKETLNGLVVIRAFGKTEWFLQEYYARLSHNQRMFYGHYMVNRWFSSRIPLVGGLVSICTCSGIVWSVRQGSITPGMAGLLAVYSLSFWGVLNWGVRIWSEVEARMTSMERVKRYSLLEPEPLVVKPGEVPAGWPSRGEVRFEHVNARYAQHLPLVLKDLSFHIPAGHKAGIIGRTGSGKSTLFQALYRFLEVESGRILIDGVDIASVPLPRLRKALAIIPQDPTLFMGTVRRNLDRDSEFSDAELWEVLDRTALGDVIRRMPGGLEAELTENGANLSQGQRQLMCLARALLLNARVVILDEATASVDVKTDAQVQRVVRESCAGVTMLIIAHRLGTVTDCDQILEINQGRASQVFHTGGIETGQDVLSDRAYVE